MALLHDGVPALTFAQLAVLRPLGPANVLDDALRDNWDLLSRDGTLVQPPVRSRFLARKLAAATAQPAPSAGSATLDGFGRLLKRLKTTPKPFSPTLIPLPALVRVRGTFMVCC